MSETCAACGFVYDIDATSEAGPEIVRGAGEIADIIASRADNPRERPSADVWSTLEYACHLRDVLLVQRERVLLARREIRPSLVPMGRDERAEHDGYNEQLPSDVARQLRDAAALFANVLARLDDEQWKRTVLYNFPAPAERDLAWVAVHTQHEVHHHLGDVRAQVVDRPEN